MFMKNFLNINICFTLAIFQKTKFYDNQNKMVVRKMKMNTKKFQSINLLDENRNCIVCFQMMVKNLTQQKE